ncbi:fibronectin type III domain-containing protein, partial [bacterium]|nr:fibronectin type III domain-containing protein [bacterium]
ITQLPGGALQVVQTLDDNAPVIDVANTTLNLGTGRLTIAWKNTVFNVPDAGCILANVSYDVVPDPQTITTDQVDAIAWQRTDVGVYANLYYSVRDGGQSRLYRANPATGSAAFVAGQFGRVGAATNAYIQDAADSLGIVTGMAFVGGTLYGVDDTGNFFSISQGTAGATVIASFGVRFAGLTLGPQNLEGGRFANTLFAIDDGGVLRAIETDGTLLSVFDVDGNGVLEDSLDTGASLPTGLAFSPLDVNLWHPTTRRRGDAGHGINAAPDNTREAVEGGTSFYFGFEQYATGNAPYAGYAAVNGQYGAVAGAWQQDLSTNDAIGNNYNLPGGAYGSLITNAFDLSSYSYTDKPTLYFNYLLQTQNAASKTDTMRDSARVLISLDGGEWQLLATNNSARSDLDDTDGELPNVITASSRLTTLDNQHVQELYDTAQWRQARVDIGRYAGLPGSDNVRLRFDFSTAGMFDPDARDAAGNLLNDIDGLANETGNFNSSQRGQQNDHEGFYIDDIIVGFAERGEMVTGVSAVNTAFFDTDTPVSGTSFPQVLQGAYQLEIRRGTEYAVAAGGTENTATIYRTFDTNDRMIASEYRLGDSNLPREQGVFVVDSNVISNSRDYGIAIDAGDRGVLGVGGNSSSTPYPGVPLNLHSANGSRLVPGAVLVNNIVSTSGQAGILFSGDAFTGNGPLAAVPLGTIINNTIYGGATAGGIGIQVTDNAAPTILNTIFANLATGVDVDASSRIDQAGRPRTVVARSAYSSVTSQVTGASESQAIVLSGNPFVNAAGGNFYLVQGTEAVDSAMDALQDRSEFVDVTSAIGIPPSPILAPATDVFGQLRGDDPTQGSQPGLGANAVKDRGAVEHIDSSRPYATLLNPEDQSVKDLDTEFDAVILTAAQITGLSRFELALVDVNGTGIDPATVVAEAFGLTRDGRQLVAGTDYLFRYVEGTQRVVFEAPAVFPLGTYLIRVDSRAATDTAAGRVTDRANNPLQPNASETVGAVTTEFTQFKIVMVESVTPGVPLGVGGTPGEDFVNLFWTAPASQGLGSITDYLIQYSTDGGGNWTDFTDSVSAATTATVTGLTHVGHIFRVKARTNLGDSGYSAPSAEITPRQVPPDAVTNLAATPGDRQVELTWNAPVYAGSQPITDYVIRFSPDNGANWSPVDDGVGTGTRATVTGLENGRSYLFEVKARNIRGDSLPTQSGPVTPRTAAATPTNVTGIRGDRDVSLSWTAPTDNGGTPITDYVVQYRTDVGGSNWQTFGDGTSPGTTARVTGLVNGTAYRFRVAAVTSFGTGIFSAESSPVTPAGLPGVPTTPVAEAGDGQVSLSWSSPADNGSPVSGHAVEYSSNGGATWTRISVGSSPTTTVTGLTNGTGYLFRVAAVNEIGQGQFSAASAVATPGPQAAAPRRLTGRAGDSSVALVWTAPRVARGQTIVDYVIDVRTVSGGVPGPWQRASDGVSATPSATITGLTNGQGYQFRVAAVTSPSSIVGAFSTESAVHTPQGLPAVPQGFVVAKQSPTSVVVRWSPPLAAARVAGGQDPAITGYVVQYRDVTSSRWLTKYVSAASTSYAVRVSATKSYAFRIAARSATGTGAFSSEVRA